MCLQGLARWRPELEDELGPLPTGFFDTPIIVYLLKTRPEYFKRCVLWPALCESATGFVKVRRVCAGSIRMHAVKHLSAS